MFIYTNPNPIETIGDSVVRTISVVTGNTWEETYMKLCVKGLSMYSLPHLHCVWSSYLKELGYEKFVISNDYPDCYSVRDFANEHKDGIYILSSGTYLVPVIDGNICDSWDSGNEIPMYYFMKVREAEENE